MSVLSRFFFWRRLGIAPQSVELVGVAFLWHGPCAARRFVEPLSVVSFPRGLGVARRSVEPVGVISSRRGPRGPHCSVESIGVVSLQLLALLIALMGPLVSHLFSVGLILLEPPGVSSLWNGLRAAHRSVGPVGVTLQRVPRAARRSVDLLQCLTPSATGFALLMALLSPLVSPCRRGCPMTHF